MAEEMDTEVAAYRNGKEVTDEEQEPSRDIPRRYISNLREMTPKVNYDFNQQRRYHIPRVGQAWSVSFFLHNSFSNSFSSVKFFNICYTNNLILLLILYS